MNDINPSAHGEQPIKPDATGRDGGPPKSFVERWEELSQPAKIGWISFGIVFLIGVFFTVGFLVAPKDEASNLPSQTTNDPVVTPSQEVIPAPAPAATAAAGFDQLPANPQTSPQGLGNELAPVRPVQPKAKEVRPSKATQPQKTKAKSVQKSSIKPAKKPAKSQKSTKAKAVKQNRTQKAKPVKKKSTTKKEAQGSKQKR